jgi:CRISPR-associated protein Csd2
MTSRAEFKEAVPLQHRYELALLFDVTNGNPNGDPDADNQPRVDPETGNGLVTDVCIKRKVRNFVTLTKLDPDSTPKYSRPLAGWEGYEIYVKDRGILANQQKRAYDDPEIQKVEEKKKIDAARDWMCKNFFDVRTFGAVMTTGKAEQEEDGEPGKRGRSKGLKLWNCGQVRGPVQFGFARSIDPIVSLSHTITRVALTNASDVKAAAQTTEEGEEKAGSGQMGRKHGVLYGLYQMHGFISPFLARDTNFSERDLGVFLNALINAFELDRSASRGEMAVRGLWLFEHNTELGNAPAHSVLETVSFDARPEGFLPRAFTDYANLLHAPEDGSEPLAGVHAWRYV